MPQPKLQQLKEQAYTLAKSLGLHCTQTKHLKKRFGIGLDFRTKSGWLQLLLRLNELAGGVVISYLLQQPIAIAA